MRLCRCGAIVDDRCPRCDIANTQTTVERGYDYRWKRLSERKRIADPLCEECVRMGRTTPATEVHHIHRIQDAPQLRLTWANLMSVCRACHERLEKELQQC